MTLGFSDIAEEYENESEMYDRGCGMLGSSDDYEYAETESKKYNESCSVIGVHT